MDRLFGQLRSILHSAPPDAATWRRITRLIQRAPADYAAHTLVPYADRLLDATWPDAQRLAPGAWLDAIGQGHTPVGWPLVRALRAHAHAPLPAALLRGELLGAITHIDAAHDHAGSPQTLAILTSPALRALRSFHGYSAREQPALLETLLTRHPTLHTLRTGSWQQPLTTPLSEANLPALHTLDLRFTQLSQPIAHDLLHAAHLPALRDLCLNLTRDLARDTLREAPLLGQLSSLRVHQSASTHTRRARQQRSTSADLLHALPTHRLDHLAIVGGLNTPEAIEALLSSQPPAPRALTLEYVSLGVEDRARLARWSGMDGLESLNLLGAMADWDLSLAPLLQQPWAASLRALTLRGNHSATLMQTLSDAPLRRLEALTLDECTLRGWETGELNNLPALAHLSLDRVTMLEGASTTLASAPWLDQLRALRVSESMPRGERGEPLCHRAASLGALAALELRRLGISADQLALLCAAPMAALRTLRLDAPDAMTPAHLEPLREAAWLPQLDALELPIKHCPALARHNLRADLLRHGLPRAAHVSY